MVKVKMKNGVVVSKKLIDRTIADIKKQLTMAKKNLATRNGKYSAYNHLTFAKNKLEALEKYTLAYAKHN